MESLAGHVSMSHWASIATRGELDCFAEHVCTLYRAPFVVGGVWNFLLSRLVRHVELSLRRKGRENTYLLQEMGYCMLP